MKDASASSSLRGKEEKKERRKRKRPVWRMRIVERKDIGRLGRESMVGEVCECVCACVQ
jgi:hypothetical protein